MSMSSFPADIRPLKCFLAEMWWDTEKHVLLLDLDL